MSSELFAKRKEILKNLVKEAQQTACSELKNTLSLYKPSSEYFKPEIKHSSFEFEKSISNLETKIAAIEKLIEVSDKAEGNGIIQ